MGRGSRVRVIEATYWPREERALLSTLLLAPSDEAPTIAETGENSDIEAGFRNLSLGDGLRRGGMVVDLLESPVEVLASVFDGPPAGWKKAAGGEKAADVRRGLAIATVCTSRDQVGDLRAPTCRKTYTPSFMSASVMCDGCDGLICLSCRAVCDGSAC